jgi:hypothetical protein
MLFRYSREKLSAVAASLLVAMTAGTAQGANAHKEDLKIPHYDHIIVIVEENKSYSQIMNHNEAPHIREYARNFGSAKSMYGEVHLSQGNYLAMIAGTTLAMSDDDAWYCVPGMRNGFCGNSSAAGYQPHSVEYTPNLVEQLNGAHLTWRGYFGSLPADGSTAIISAEDATHPAALYAAKHNPFNNIASIRNAPGYAHHIVGLNHLSDDISKHSLPNFSLVVPDQCDEMHGLHQGPDVDESCSHSQKLIERGDSVVANMVDQIQHSQYWESEENLAIIITWDEDDRSTLGQQGCCGYEPTSRGNFGGGHIPTVVITNHGPRRVVDLAQYNHYSMLRTIDDAFGLHDYPGLSAAWNKGVRPMLSLFAVQ